MRAELPAAPQSIAAEARALELLAALLSGAEGRELATWLVIDLCGARNRLMATIGSAEATAYAAGRRDTGLQLEELLERADGNGWHEAIAERRKAKAKAEMDREKKRAEKAQETDG